MEVHGANCKCSEFKLSNKGNKSTKSLINRRQFIRCDSTESMPIVKCDKFEWPQTGDETRREKVPFRP